jgi:hypothetical protein
VVAPELRDDLGDQRLELGIEAVLRGVQDAVAVHDPAEIAGLLRAQEVSDPGRRPGAKQALDRAHRFEQTPSPTRRQGPEHRADLVARGLLEQPERRPTVRGQRQKVLAAIGREAIDRSSRRARSRAGCD